MEIQKDIIKELKIKTVAKPVIAKENEIKDYPESLPEESKILIDSNNWEVPAKYQKMKNPTEANKANIAIGKSLHSKFCKSCHGKDGLGDRPKANEVDGGLGDFSSKKFQAQTDGTLFYKSYFGRDDMPNYEKKIPNQEDCGQLFII